MGMRLQQYTSSSPSSVWSRPLANGDVAVALYNQNGAEGNTSSITVTFSEVGMIGKVNVYDIWAQKSLGAFENSYTAKYVPFHGTAFFRLSKASDSVVV